MLDTKLKILKMAPRVQSDQIIAGFFKDRNEWRSSKEISERYIPNASLPQRYNALSIMVAPHIGMLERKVVTGEGRGGEYLYRLTEKTWRAAALGIVDEPRSAQPSTPLATKLATKLVKKRAAFTPMKGKTNQTGTKEALKLVWNMQERDKIALEMLNLLRHRPGTEPHTLIRQAELVLPENRRREKNMFPSGLLWLEPAMNKLRPSAESRWRREAAKEAAAKDATAKDATARDAAAQQATRDAAAAQAAAQATQQATQAAAQQRQPAAAPQARTSAGAMLGAVLDSLIDSVFTEKNAALFTNKLQQGIAKTLTDAIDNGLSRAFVNIVHHLTKPGEGRDLVMALTQGKASSAHALTRTPHPAHAAPVPRHNPDPVVHDTSEPKPKLKKILVAGLLQREVHDIVKEFEGALDLRYWRMGQGDGQLRDKCKTVENTILLVDRIGHAHEGIVRKENAPFTRLNGGMNELRTKLTEIYVEVTQ